MFEDVNTNIPLIRDLSVGFKLVVAGNNERNGRSYGISYIWIPNEL